MPFKYIYARRENQITKFTETIWNNMAKDKNGWQQITEADYNAAAEALQKGADLPDLKAVDTSKAAQEAKGGADYKNLVERAKGLEQDGKVAEALALYRKALGIKSTKGVSGKIAKLEETLRNAEAAEPLLADAKAAEEGGDIPMALELWKSLLELGTEGAKEKVEELEAKLLD